MCIEESHFSRVDLHVWAYVDCEDVVGLFAGRAKQAAAPEREEATPALLARFPLT